MENIKMDHHKIINDLTRWFETKPYWLRKALELLIAKKGEIEESSYKDLTDLCILQAQGKINPNPIHLELGKLIHGSEEEVILRLESIGDIEQYKCFISEQTFRFWKRKFVNYLWCSMALENQAMSES